MYVISKGAEGAKKYFTYIYLFIINMKIRPVWCISSDSANVLTMKKIHVFEDNQS